jgi:uncharacterized protein (DUF1800 family)
MWGMSVDTAPDSVDSAAVPRRRGMTRRQALAAAAATGVGVGAVRLLGGTMQNLSQPRPAAGSDWISPLGSESARVMHLLRRATFGYTDVELETALSAGFNRTVDRLLEAAPAEPPMFDASSTPGGRFPIAQLQQWWVNHMLGTPTPFAERMTLFWHGHFTSDYRKAADHTFMYWQNLTWRRMAFTNLRSMLMQVTTDPAMLRYLDLATSTGQSPNENYSRELMELFTMGPGNYSEEDVRQGARALAGWQLPRPDSYASVTVDNANQVVRRLPVYITQVPGVFNNRRAYQGTVTFLGQTGSIDTQGVIDRILAQPATAQLIVAKVARDFVNPQPEQGFVNRLADAFRRSDYDVKTLMRSIFTSPEFTAAASYRALLKSPTELMVHASKALGGTGLSRVAVAAGSGMGQSLFDPPDVNGWPNNAAWISTNTVVERVNFATAALGQMKASLPSASAAVHRHLEGIVSPQTANLFNQAADEDARWFIVLASPEFQLK